MPGKLRLIIVEKKDCCPQIFAAGNSKSIAEMMYADKLKQYPVGKGYQVTWVERVKTTKIH